MLDHYSAVVEFIHNNRFAIASQVARRFPAWIASARTAQYQLANLRHLGFIEKAPVHSTGPHFPYVYYATNRGVHLVRQAYDRLGQPRELSVAEHVHDQGHALTSILHELMLTEFALRVHLAAEERPDVCLAFSERRFFRRDRQLRYSVHGRMHRVDPDYGFLLRTTAISEDRQGGQNVRGTLYLVEWDNGTMSLARIRDKYRHYAAWADSEWGRAQVRSLFARHQLSTEHADFRLLVIAHDKAREHSDAARLADLLAKAIELPARMRDRIWLTTAEALAEASTDRLTLEQSIWLRARDARMWITAYRNVMTKHNGASAIVRSRLQRQLVAKQLARMPRHMPL